MSTIQSTLSALTKCLNFCREVLFQITCAAVHLPEVTITTSTAARHPANNHSRLCEQIHLPLACKMGLLTGNVENATENALTPLPPGGERSGICD